jgi:hypothetical protein
VAAHVAAVEAVLLDLAPHPLPASGANALAVLEDALQRVAAVVDKCRGLGALGRLWHALDVKKEFQDAQQARSWRGMRAGRGGMHAGHIGAA